MCCLPEELKKYLTIWLMPFGATKCLAPSSPFNPSITPVNDFKTSACIKSSKYLK